MNMKNRIQAKQSPVRKTTLAYSHRYGCAAVLESDLEVDYFNWRNFEGEFEHFQMQPESFFYEINGNERRYTADAELIENNILFVDEVKFKYELGKPKNINKFNILAELYRTEDKVFRLMTEDEIRVGHRAKNLAFLAPAWAYKPPFDEFDSFSKKLKSKPSSISELHKQIVKHNQAHCLIRRAIAHRLIKCDITQPWSELHLSW